MDFRATMYHVIHNDYRHRINPYHRRRCERLDGKNVGIRRYAWVENTYVDVGLDKRYLAHRNVLRWVHRRIFLGGL